MLPVKKVYVESRYRTKESVDASNFKFELPFTIQCPANTVFFITDVSIPHVWNLIETDFNDKLYFTYLAIMPGSSAVWKQYYGSITIPPGEYAPADLASRIQTLMNASASGNNISFTAVYNSAVNTITITCSGLSANGEVPTFKFYTDAELMEQPRFHYTNLSPTNPQTANDILNISVPTDFTTSFSTGFVCLQPINNVFLTSPNFGSFDTIAPFSNNVVKKIPVNAPYGYMIFDQQVDPSDYLDCSEQVLKTLEFHLKDSRGRYVRLHNMNISFSIVFQSMNSRV